MNTENAAEIYKPKYHEVFSNVKENFEDLAIEAMIEYAKAKVKEQREICANSHEEKLKEYWNVHNIDELQVEIDNIKNAPTPDFE